MSMYDLSLDNFAYIPVVPVKPLILSLKSDKSAPLIPSPVPNLIVDEIITSLVVFMPFNLNDTTVWSSVLLFGETLIRALVCAVALTPVEPSLSLITSAISFAVKALPIVTFVDPTCP